MCAPGSNRALKPGPSTSPLDYEGDAVALTERLADYIRQLEHCLAKTHRAEDRPVYERLMSDAAGMLAGSVVKESAAALQTRLETHERLWGHAWLQDDIYREAASAWARVKNEAHHLAI